MQLIFALIYLPLFFVGTWLLDKHFDVLKGFEFIFFLCGIAISSLIIFILLKLTAIKGQQEWKLINGKLIYKSPSSLLGKFFEVNWEDVSKVYTLGDCDFARCELVYGAHVEFYIGDRNGWEFFNSLKELKAEPVGAPNP